MDGWPQPARTAVGCGGGCAVLALLQVVGVWGVIYMMAHLRPPDGLRTRAVYPKVVKAGTRFPLTVVVENTGSEAFTVQNVLGREDLLEKLTLSNPQPAPKRQNNMAGTATWTYEETVAPGKSWKLRFDAQVVKPGKLNDRLEVQVNLAPNPVRIRLQAE